MNAIRNASTELKIARRIARKAEAARRAGNIDTAVDMLDQIDGICDRLPRQFSELARQEFDALNERVDRDLAVISSTRQTVGAYTS